MTITSRAYTGAEDLAAMQSAMVTWVQMEDRIIYPHVGDILHRLYNGSRGMYPAQETARIWEQDGAIIGFALAYPRHAAFDVCIHPSYRGGDFERELVCWPAPIVLDWREKLGLEAKPLAADALDTDHERRDVLLSLGYVQERHWINITMRSLLTDIPEPILPDGYTIRPAQGVHEAEGLAAVHCGAFNSTWTGEQYRDAVMRNPGYDPQREYVVVAPDGRFAAFTVTWRDALNKIGLFEPVGTHKDFHRQGLGRAMMSHVMHRMRDDGMTSAMVGHEVDNPASTGLYANLGFEVVAKVIEYKQELSTTHHATA